MKKNYMAQSRIFDLDSSEELNKLLANSTEIQKQPRERKTTLLSKRIPVWSLCIAFLLAYVAACGTVALYSVSKANEKLPSPKELVYYTPNGEEFHRSECPVLVRLKNIKSIEYYKAKDLKGLEPCSYCIKN